MRRVTALCLLLTAYCLLASASASALPPVRHVFLIVLENKDYSETFGSQSPIPYLSRSLTSQGELLTHYYGTGHESLDNYITMISGQPPNPYTQADAPAYADFVGTTRSDGVAVGMGSIFPPEVKTVADQLDAKGLTWKAYMEDMKTPCQHPAPGSPDTTQSASASSQYAMRHNPFVYFHSLIDGPSCSRGDVPLDRLSSDLASESTTPDYVFITPDLCHDGHDATCADGGPGGYAGMDQFLRAWVPKITGAPAFRDGLLMITFDESASGADSCCHEPTGPNTPNNGGPTQGNGGGRVGAVLLSPFVRAGSVVDTPYNHYSLLRSVEDIFGLPHLAYAAQDGLVPFGNDVFNAAATSNPAIGAAKPLRVKLSHAPRGCARRPFRIRVSVTGTGYRRAQAKVDSRRVAGSRKARFKVPVATKRLRPGGHRLTVRAVGSGGRSASRTLRFRVCR